MAVLSCPLCCNKKFSNRSELKHHLTEMLEDILCTLCNEKFRYISEFILHLSDCEADGTDIYQTEEVSNDSEELESTKDFLTKYSEKNKVRKDLFAVSETTSDDINTKEEGCCKDIYTSFELKNEEENENVDLEENQNKEDVKTDIEDISYKNIDDQAKDLFTCSFCEVSFSSIRDHISTFHENEDVVVDVGVEPKINQQNFGKESMHVLQKRWQVSDVGYYFTDSIEGKKNISTYINKKNDWPNNLKVYPLITYVSTKNVINGETNNEPSLILKNMGSLYKGCRVRFVVVEGDDNGPKLEDVPFFELPSENIYPTLELNTDILCDIKATYLVVWHCSLCNKNSHSWEKLSHHECNNWFVCSVCDAKFTQEMDIISHLTVHSKSEKWLYCIICQKFIVTKEYMSHIQLHVNLTSKEFSCVKCNHQFKSEIDLDLHSNVCKSKDVKEEIICDLCGKNLINLELLREHMVTHGFPMYKYICSYCSKPFKRLALKEAHENKHTQTKPYECPLCGHRFGLHNSLVKHMRIHSGEKPYSCSLCDKSYRTQNILKNHILIHSSETPYTCQFCSKQFKTKDNLRNHEYTHRRPHVCPLCTCSFESSYKLKKHQEKHEAGSLNFLCGVCPQMFSRPSYLWNHQKTKHNIDSEHSRVKKEDHEILSYYALDNVVKCSLCKCSVTTDLLETHMQEHRDNGTQLTCQGCHKEYSKIEDFNFHTFTCSKLIPEADKYKCTECNENCSSVDGLRNHMVTHGILIRNYPCSYCYKSFNHPSQKIKHENIHTNKKPFVCRDCSKRFHSKSALLSHLRLHTGERPFSCAICMKRFRSDVLLQSHLNIHSSQGKFQCSSCPKVFKSKANARLHGYTHTKPFSCPLCTKPFDSSFKVKKHLKMHTLGSLQYKCDNCPQMFSRSSYCIKHMSLDHGIMSINEKETMNESINTVCCIICSIEIPLDEYEEHLKNHCSDEKHSETS